MLLSAILPSSIICLRRCRQEDDRNKVQDGRLAPAHFSPNNKIFYLWLISTILGIIDLSGLLSKVLNSRYFLNHILKILRKSTTSRTSASASLWEYECKEHISEYVYRVTLYTDKSVHWDLDERRPVGSIGDRWIEISRRITLMSQ